jgi:hypothetical protein
MAEIIWVGAGWYRRLRFAVGGDKIVQASPNKEADMPADCYWCESITHCGRQFEEGCHIIKSQRITY